MLAALAKQVRSAYDALTAPSASQGAQLRHLERRITELEAEMPAYRIDMANLADKAEEVLDRAAARQARASAQEGRRKAEEKKNGAEDPEAQLDELMASDPDAYRALMETRNARRFT